MRPHSSYHKLISVSLPATFKRSITWLPLLVLFSTRTQAQLLPYLYKTGTEGYTCFRIPAIITTPKGTLLAFAEGRKNSCGDAGAIDLVLKRSTDKGKTWTALQVVWSDSNNTCGNPTPVVEEKSGNIFLLATWNLGSDHEKDIIAGRSTGTRRVFVLQSANEGCTWSQPAEITAAVKKEAWAWYATGPGRGVQLSSGPHKGRLIIPCNSITKYTGQNKAHAIYSDDAGHSWHLGGIVPQDSVNENTVAETSGGGLLFNMRNASGKRLRQVSYSTDGGMTLSGLRSDSTLIEPVCEGNLLSFVWKKRRYLLFSNPASTTGRNRLTLRLSPDDGRTWPWQKELYNGPSAYSCNTFLNDGRIACLYEAGIQKPYEGIVFETLPLADLLNTTK